MKVKIRAQPLIFYFKSSDGLLDSINLLKRSSKRIYRFQSGYCMATELRLSERKSLPILLKSGRYFGRGKVLEAFLAEHQ